MQPTWHPELVVDEALAKSLLDEQFPELTPVALSFLGEGFDNTVYTANERWVFRFPRRQLGAELLEQELRVIAKIATRLPLPISVPIWVGQASEKFRWKFAGYQKLPGVEACRASLTEDERTQLAPALGGFLRALHSLPKELIAALSPAPDTLGKMSLEKRIPVAREALLALVEAGFIDDEQHRALLSGVGSTPALSGERVLVHGDLYSRHILLGENRSITGIIDWGDVHLNHPACDLSIAYCFLPPRARAAFWSAYGGCEPEAQHLAWFRGVYHNALVARYALGIQDLELTTASRLAFQYLVESNPG